MGKLQIKELDNDIVEIEGIWYTHELFKAFAKSGLNLNEPFVITERKDHAFTIKRLGRDCISGLPIKSEVNS